MHVSFLTLKHTFSLEPRLVSLRKGEVEEWVKFRLAPCSKRIQPAPASKSLLPGRGAGLAGLFSWVVATRADRDLFFPDLHVLSGWGPVPNLYHYAHRPRHCFHARYPRV